MSIKPGARKSEAKRASRRSRLQPLDRLSLTLMVGLSLAVVVLVALGDRAAARVRDFSWQAQRVGAEEVAFLLTFSRPMDETSVEQNLKIEPPLPGKFSWAGRRMAYTLDFPIPYGETFEMSLDQAQDRFSQSANFDQFKTTFQSRDRGLVYIGIEGENQGRLVLYNLTQQQEVPLTPKDWVVLDFKPYPVGDRILFSAVDYKAYQQGQQAQKLYTVTTGLPAAVPETRRFWQRPSTAAPVAGDVKMVLDSQEYQNLKFDLSPDGKTIVVQRLSMTNPSDFGPWVLTEGTAPRPLETDPGGDFVIAPDSQSLLLQQGEGTAIIALSEDPTVQETVGETLDFLPEYGLVLDMASDGTAAAMVSFNQNDPEKRFTQTLFWVSSQGEEKPLLDATGSILDAQFDPTNELLYCLISQLLPGETYQVQPYLISVNVKTGKKVDLIAMPPQPSVNMSISPDGLAILFDETVAADSANLDERSAIRAEDGRVISAGRLWLLPLFKSLEDRLAKTPSPVQPQTLPFSGLHPVWLP
ncbi:MAG: hypothetical protein AAFV72_06960 [Cyanobacteria bacterium J06635_1]